MRRSSLSEFNYSYWNGKTDGGHRYSSEEWLAKYAEELAAIVPAGGVLLDIGCGSCQLTTHLASRFDRVYGADFSQTMVAAGRARIEALGIANMIALPGSMHAFPPEIQRADAIVSYGVLQYLTLGDLAEHLRECDRVLADGGRVCIANIPNARRRGWYYREKLVPRAEGRLGLLRQQAVALQRRINGRLRGDFLWDSIGNWFTAEDIAAVAAKAGFEVEFRHAWYYEYRLHALLWRGEAR